MDRQKLIHQLFIGKVADFLGVKKTTELLEESKEAFAIPDVTTRFNVDKKIFKKHRSCVGIIRYKSDFGFNYWIVEWDNGNWSREYGLDLNVW